MGIEQLFKKREEPQEEENLKEIFESIKSQEIPHKTGKKVINITYISRCGCGAINEIKYHAIVPEDYDDVEDGDIIDDDYIRMKALEDVAGEIYSGVYEGSVEDHNPYDYYVW